ncbi:hypothetical protein PsYK624_014320 [Phanerochaete sordida]|uniref:Uncharacterized protein n=1 Tax=Phanerochaete sordida TaxID=48140 RepID=A0A9P3FY50_9APHY|nr:hypothetical protein PsYK624_014320 [Phanerochaete sordida]
MHTTPFALKHDCFQACSLPVAFHEPEAGSWISASSTRQANGRTTHARRAQRTLYTPLDAVCQARPRVLSVLL